MDLENRLEQQSRDVMANGRFWLNKAQSLKLAADQILMLQQESCEELFKRKEGKPLVNFLKNQNKAELFSIYMMLMGYALENCIKGIIISREVKKDPKLLADKNFKEISFFTKGGKEIKIKTHNLIDLFNAKDIDINLTNREKQELEGVTEFVVWFGRYPGPNKFDGKGILDATKRGASSTIYYHDERPTILNSIYDKAWDELSELSKQFTITSSFNVIV